jgi:hypothetical protein
LSCPGILRACCLWSSWNIGQQSLQDLLYNSVTFMGGPTQKVTRTPLQACCASASQCMCPTQHNKLQPCSNSLDGSVLNVCHTILIWHWVSFIFPAFWRSLLVVTGAEVQGAACKAQNSVLKATFTGNTLWPMPEPSGWLCGEAGHSSIFSWEMLFWIKICWVSGFPVCILTFWSTRVYVSQILLRVSAVCVTQGDASLFVILSYYAFVVLLMGVTVIVVTFTIVVFHGKH